MEYKEITEKVIGCAFRVYNQMGFGYLESIYEKCMHIELKKAGLKFESQHPIAVYYDDIIVGEFAADIVVEEIIIVELKSVKRIVKAHEMQLVNYLTSTGKPVGRAFSALPVLALHSLIVSSRLIINFGELKVEIKRKVKDLRNID